VFPGATLTAGPGRRRSPALLRLLTEFLLLCLFVRSPLWAVEADSGEYLLNSGGCVACHTKDGGGRLAGGRELESPFGVFYAPNITPDTATGIGNWTDDDFVRAFHEGVSPEDSHYYPAFPYTSYTGMSREDLLKIKAYLDALEPVTNDVPDHDLVWYASWRWPLVIWKWLYFNEGRFVPDDTQDAAWNRGAYLVRHVGHCGECHTPRTVFGGFRRNSELKGAPGFGEAKSAPNLTPHEDGLGDWRRGDWELLLEVGMLPNGDFAGGEMGVVVDENTALLTDADRAAMINYLRNLPPLAN